MIRSKNKTPAKMLRRVLALVMALLLIAPPRHLALLPMKVEPMISAKVPPELPLMAIAPPYSVVEQPSKVQSLTVSSLPLRLVV